MIQTKIKKSYIANQDNAYLSAGSQPSLAFIPLVQIHNNKLELMSEGLKILQEQCSGKTYLVSYEGVKANFLYSLYRNNTIFIQKRTSSGIWISNVPRSQKESDENYLYLEILIINNDDAAKLHAFAAVVSSCLMINLLDFSNYSFLNALQGRVIYDRTQKDDKWHQQNVKKQLASLLLIKKSNTNLQPFQMLADQSELFDFLSQSNLMSHVVDFYPEIQMIKTPRDELTSSDYGYLDEIQKKIMSLCRKKNTTLTQLGTGPLIAEYLQSVKESLNKKGMVEITECKKNIEITEGYAAYLKSVKLYQELLRKHVKEDGVQNFKEIILNIRSEAIETYGQHSTDAFYLNKLHEYIAAKEEVLTSENNKGHQIKNIDLLQKESDALIAKFANSKQKVSEAMVKTELDQFVTRYNHTAEGENKHQLLNKYLNILTPTIYKAVRESDLRKSKQEIDSLNRKNAELAERLKKLENQSKAHRGGCSDCCELM